MQPSPGNSCYWTQMSLGHHLICLSRLSWSSPLWSVTFLQEMQSKPVWSSQWRVMIGPGCSCLVGELITRSGSNILPGLHPDWAGRLWWCWPSQLKLYNLSCITFRNPPGSEIKMSPFPSSNLKALHIPWPPPCSSHPPGWGPLGRYLRPISLIELGEFYVVLGKFWSPFIKHE